MGSPFIIPGRSPKTVLQDTRVQVSDVGDLVRVEFGSTVIDIPYETAFQISGWMRVHAKRAKATAGDTSRNWRTLAILDGLKE